MARKRTSEKQIVVSGVSAVPARHKPTSPKRVTYPAAVETSDTPASEPELMLAAAATATAAAPSQDAVAKLAYSYWEARGYEGGSPEADWLRAEHELRATLTAQ
jgi:hypothetical protein